MSPRDRIRPSAIHAMRRRSRSRRRARCLCVCGSISSAAIGRPRTGNHLPPSLIKRLAEYRPADHNHAIDEPRNRLRGRCQRAHGEPRSREGLAAFADSVRQAAHASAVAHRRSQTILRSRAESVRPIRRARPNANSPSRQCAASRTMPGAEDSQRSRSRFAS